MSEALAVQAPGLSVGRWREATDVANLCKEIVYNSSVKIGDREYVKVEGWTSIAVAHGCIASVKSGSVVEVLRDGRMVGIKAVAEIRRQSDGVVLSEAEGYVGDDEETWFGSHGLPVKKWNQKLGREVEKIIPKRNDYAIRSMAQTRAVAKACRNAFSHVVVLMDKGLSTTPYEEIAGAEEADFDEQKAEQKKERRAEPAHPDDPPARTKSEKSVDVPRGTSVELERQFEEGRWKQVKVHFGNTNRGKMLGDLERKSLEWYCWKWAGGTEGFNGRPPSQDDKILRAACNMAITELGMQEPAN